VWALLVDGRFGPGLPPAEPFPIPVHTGDVRVDVQAALAMLAPYWGYRPLLDIDDEEAREPAGPRLGDGAVLRRAVGRGIGVPAVPQRRIDECRTITERFMTRWRGEPDPAHTGRRRLLGLGRRARHERLDVHRPRDRLHRCRTWRRRCPARSARCPARCTAAPGARAADDRGGRAHRRRRRRWSRGILDRREKLMGFGHRVYRAEDPRARVLRRTCRELDAPRYEVAVALEQAALAELRERRPDHPIETNVEFWAAVILDFAEVPPHMMPAMFTSARTAGWSAHILEQKRENKLVRPSAQYIGPGPRRPQDVEGWETLGR
jgi:citrate synthase